MKERSSADRIKHLLLMLALTLGRLLVPPAMGDGGESLPVAEWLDRLGKTAELFWQQFPTVTCTESVQQVKLGLSDKILHQRGSVFDYLIFMRMQGDDLWVEESRLLQKESGKSENLPLLITQGFSTLSLILHPFYQAGFEFQVLDDGILDGSRVVRVGFAHVRGARSTMALRLRGRTFPLSLRGVVWVEPGSGRLLRITAELNEPMEDLGLRTLAADVRYSSVRFKTIQAEYWLPTVATIDLQTRKQHWRNTHRFLNYRHFSVQSESSVP